MLKQAWDARRTAAATKVAAAFRGMMQRKQWAARDADRVQREAVRQLWLYLCVQVFMCLCVYCACGAAYVGISEPLCVC